MPDCLQCGEHFAYRYQINGKYHNLQNRKYCLICSPFKQHNTRRFDKPKKGGRTTQCQRCEKYYLYERNTGASSKHCSACCVTIRRNKKKQRCLDYMGGECRLCGYKKAATALIFHHKNPIEKDFAISACYHKSWEDIKIELDKCVLLCQNCHSEVHEGVTVLKDS